MQYYVQFSRNHISPNHEGLTLIIGIYLLSLFFVLTNFCSTSVVYNLKIAETTKRQEHQDNEEHPSSIAITPFSEYRQKYDGHKHYYTGGLFNYIFSPGEYFLRADCAFAYVNAQDFDKHVKKIEMDDLLFSGGYSYGPSKRVRVTISGLLGIPTHKDKGMLEAQFGYAHIGLGAQIDNALYIFERTSKYSLRSALRLIHFFARNVSVASTVYDYRLGNLADLFLAFHIHSAKHHGEVGYNPKFFFNASIHPFFEKAVEKANFSRNTFYVSYRYKFFMREYPSAFACALSYGFDIKPRTVGNKRMVTVWASWSIGF